jgi:Ca-activated chloride channel family protein
MLTLLALLACTGIQDPDDTGLSQPDDGTRSAQTTQVEATGPVHIMRLASPSPSSGAYFPPAPDEVMVPGGQVITRSCYSGGEGRKQAATSSRGLGYGGGSASGASAAPSAAPPPPMAPSPQASAPTGRTERRQKEELQRQAAGLLDAITSSGAELAEAEPSPMPESSMDMSAPEEAERAAYDMEDGDDLAFQQPAEPAGPRLDWGGTMFLSNDDSMSLASAQRLLWAVKNNARFDASEVRPHELLNYFSFDTAPVPEGQVFSIHASGQQTGEDSMTLALAVRGANPPRQPLDMTVLVDRSGSMSAEGRMDYLKRGLHQMSNSLQRGDRVSVVLFDSSVCTPLENYVVGRDDPSLLTETINAMQPRGSTNLDAGLKEAYRIATAHVDSDPQERNRRVMVVTDAFLNTGDVNTDTVSEIGKAYEQHGVRMTGVGVGREFNDTMLDKLTEKGKGAYVYLGSEAVVDRVFGLGFESLTRTIAHDVRFALTLPDSLAMEKFYGEEASTNPDDIQPINYYAGTTQLFLQDLAARSPKKGDPVKLTISWKDAATGQAQEQAYTTTVGRLLAADSHNVDKAQALMAWTDMLMSDALGGSGCSEGMDAYAAEASQVGDDAEIAYINSLINKRCGVEIPTQPVQALVNVAYKVKIDSDLPIAEVMMECEGKRVAHALNAGVNVASFDVPPGSCSLSLQGNVPMLTTVEVPATGGDVRCVVRGGRMSCS